jgi:hypothetical protein
MYLTKSKYPTLIMQVVFLSCLFASVHSFLLLLASLSFNELLMCIHVITKLVRKWYKKVEEYKRKEDGGEK